MSFPFYIARRYFFARKSSSVISAISAISVVGVTVASAALIIVLSVFNGFQDLVASFFTTFDPQLKVVPAYGKTIAADDSLLLRISQMPQVEQVSFCYEENALAVYADRQAMVTLKGVDDNYRQLSQIDRICVGDGEFCLHAANLNYGTPGILLAHKLGVGTRWTDNLQIFAPVKEGQLDVALPTEGFVTDDLLSSGVVFQVSQPKYDEHILLAPIAFVRNLFGDDGFVTSIEIRLKSGVSTSRTQREMQKIGQGRLHVLDRYEQQSDTFHIMNIEKLLAYLFLTFILAVACFNIIGTLSMLIIDKKADVQTLRNLGATDQQITRIFLFEGRIITVVGAIAGLLLGLLLCWLQQQFGLVRMGDADGTYIIDAYPVSVHLLDVVLVFFTVLLVGWLAVWYPVRRFARGLDTASSQADDELS